MAPGCPLRLYLGTPSKATQHRPIETIIHHDLTAVGRRRRPYEAFDRLSGDLLEGDIAHLHS